MNRTTSIIAGVIAIGCVAHLAGAPPALSAAAGSNRNRKDVQEEHAQIGNAAPAAALKHTSHPDAQWFPDAGIGLFLHWDCAASLGEGISWPMLPGRRFRGKEITSAEFERMVREREFSFNGTEVASHSERILGDSEGFQSG